MSVQPYELPPTEVIQSRIEKLSATLDDAFGKVAPPLHEVGELHDSALSVGDSELWLPWASSRHQSTSSVDIFQ